MILFPHIDVSFPSLCPSVTKVGNTTYSYKTTIHKALFDLLVLQISDVLTILYAFATQLTALVIESITSHLFPTKRTDDIFTAL